MPQSLKETLQRGIIPYLLCFFLGALSALSMAPYHFWPILFVSLSVFYVLLHRSSTIRAAAVYGLLFGLGYFGFGLYWIGNALLVEGNPYRWAWPLAVSGLPLMLSPFWAVGCAIIKKFAKLDNLSGYLLFTLIFTGFEWLRGHLFTGFPWNLFGYAWAETPEIAQIVALHDIYLLTFLTILWASAAGYLFLSPLNKGKKIFVCCLIALSFITASFFGLARLEKEKDQKDLGVHIVLIQPNIEQNEKWDPQSILDNFMMMVKDSGYNGEEQNPDAKATYIIWPETAISAGLLNTAQIRTVISDMLKTYPRPAYLISGTQRYLPESEQFFNSIIVFDKNGEILYTYNKSHLVPFGEYMPLSSVFDIAPIVGFKGFEAGPGPETVEMPEGISFSPLVCYEVIFPSKVIDPANSPDFIINVTNDAWYGDSPGPYQHLAQAQFRAIETGIPLIRVANTGITAVFDRKGQIIHQTHLSEKRRIDLKF